MAFETDESVLRLIERFYCICIVAEPEATFISLVGRLNDELSAVGLNVCTMCLRCS